MAKFKHICTDDLGIGRYIREIDSATKKKIYDVWEWELKPTNEVMFVTSLGKVFTYYQELDKVWFLDVYEDQITFTSFTTMKKFKDLITSEPYDEEYLSKSLTNELIDKYGELEKGKVFSLKKPYYLGGKDEVDNVDIIDIEVHFEIMSQLLKKVRSLPEGASIDSVSMES